MPVYQWKGKNRYGDIVEGRRVARSVEDLSDNLQREQITVIDIERKKAELRIPFLQTQKVKLKELAVGMGTATSAYLCFIRFKTSRFNDITDHGPKSTPPREPGLKSLEEDEVYYQTDETSKNSIAFALHDPPRCGKNCDEDEYGEYEYEYPGEYRASRVHLYSHQISDLCTGFIRGLSECSVSGCEVADESRSAPGTRFLLGEFDPRDSATNRHDPP